MHRTVRLTTLLVVGAALGAANGVARAEHPAIERAENAVESGNVDVARDIAPLLDALKRSKDTDEKRELVDTIADLGAEDSESPNSVKQYLMQNAPPILLDVVKNGNNNFLQGDAVHALRDMGCPRSVLEQAAAIAEADPDSYVQSRGEILRNYIKSMPVEDEEAGTSTKTADPKQKAAAIAYLDKRAIKVSTQSLRDAAQRADAESVKALLDAGVAADTGAADATQTPLYIAVAQACHTQGAETDWLVQTVSLLVEAGADVNKMDDNKNTPMMHAAQYCGPKIIDVLVAGGAKVDIKNGSGVSPLAMALIMSNFDAAEALVAKGAKLAKSDAAMVSGVTDPRGKAIVKKAMGG